MLRYRFSALLLACISIPASCLAVEHSTDSLTTVRNNLDQERAVLVDVREKAEWDKGHVTGALWLPLSGWQKDPASAVERLPKDKIVYLHCASGKRCLVVADLLEKQGFPSGSVRPIKPGYRDLIGAGFSSEP